MSAENQPQVGARVRRRLPSLTGLRIFGSVAVVLCHVGNGFTGPPLSIAAAYGYVGVSFFFMLSGFVLAWSCADQPARRFWWLRFSRIWPLQLLLMVFAYTVISGHEKIPGPFGHAAEVLLLQAWFPDPSIYSGGNGVTWSLSVEMFFYLLFPFAIALLRRLRGRGLAVTAVVTLAVMVLPPLVISLAGLGMPMSLYYWLFFVFPPYQFGVFLLGMVLGRAMILGLRVPGPVVACLAATAGIAGVAWAITSFTVHTGMAVARPFVALLAVPFFALLVCGSATRDLRAGGWWLSSSALVRLGEWSFALYLVHAPTLVVTARWGWWNNPGGLWALADCLAFLALTISVAAVLHYLVEKPIERRLRAIPVGAP
jgi:peptidoglycan/LPS O-acetylase OafA/YrhL